MSVRIEMGTTAMFVVSCARWKTKITKKKQDENAAAPS
jgi:hypothetical protein